MSSSTEIRCVPRENFSNEINIAYEQLKKIIEFNFKEVLDLSRIEKEVLLNSSYLKVHTMDNSRYPCKYLIIEVKNNRHQRNVENRNEGIPFYDYESLKPAIKRAIMTLDSDFLDESYDNSEWDDI